MSNPSSYKSAVDFRISNKPPRVSGGLQYIINELYNFAQQVIYALTYYCGVGDIGSDQWTLASGTPARFLTSGNMNKLYILASQTIPAGAYVNIYSNSGVLTVCLAEATTNSIPCNGFSPAGIASGSVGLVILKRGTNSSLTGLTPGQTYWLSDTVPGGIRTSPPVASGNIEQCLGIAVDASNLASDIQYPVQH